MEGTFIGGVGALIGCLAGAGLMAWIGQVGIDISFISGMGEITALMGDRLYPYVSPTGIISRGILVTFIVMLASLYPAWTGVAQGSGRGVASCIGKAEEQRSKNKETR